MDRRTLLTGGTLLVAATLTHEAGARSERVAATAEDAELMKLAIDQAQSGDYPFGAIIARDKNVLALAHNSVKSQHDPTAHAAMMAIRAFLAGHEPEDFANTTIYVSGEPCPMCMGAIIWCGLKRVVYAASIQQLSKKIDQINVSARSIANAAPFTEVQITSGVLADEALKLLDNDKK